MAPHTDLAARTRLITYDKNTCPQCSAWLLAPDWSEHISERRVRHSWSCDVCSYAFETTVFFAAPEKTAA
jgi:rubredoxin